jgi:hypothetical protein
MAGCKNTPMRKTTQQTDTRVIATLSQTVYNQSWKWAIDLSKRGIRTGGKFATLILTRTMAQHSDLETNDKLAPNDN